MEINERDIINTMKKLLRTSEVYYFLTNHQPNPDTGKLEPTMIFHLEPYPLPDQIEHLYPLRENDKLSFEWHGKAFIGTVEFVHTGAERGGTFNNSFRVPRYTILIPVSEIPQESKLTVFISDLLKKHGFHITEN